MAAKQAGLWENIFGVDLDTLPPVRRDEMGEEEWQRFLSDEADSHGGPVTVGDGNTRSAVRR